MTADEEVPLTPVSPPVPAPYHRQVSYNVVGGENFDPSVYYTNATQATIRSTDSEVDSLKGSTIDNQDDDDGAHTSTGKRRKSVLIFLTSSRIWIRAIAIFIMITSFSLILAAIVMFAKAQNHPGHPLDQVPKPAAITDHPCIVFTAVAAMNLIFSITIFCLSCLSSKFNKSNNAVNAVFTIIAAIGFSSSMGACFFLNKETTLQNDLWKWSCGNQQNGISSDALNFDVVCQVISYGWKFGLVQASLELLTFIISVTAFVLLKYSYFARYGRIGKVF